MSGVCVATVRTPSFLPNRATDAVGQCPRPTGPRAHRIETWFTVILVAVDLALIGLDVVWGLLDATGRVPDRPGWVQLDRDASIAERFNFAKWAFAAIVLGLAAARRRPWWFASAAMLVLLADDLGRLHERTGQEIESWFGDEEGTILAALVELGFFAVLAVVVFSLLLAARRRVSSAHRPLATGFVVLVLVLAVFGVGVDFVHTLVGALADGQIVDVVLYLVEDGGEMLLISLIAAHALRTRLAVGDRTSAPRRPGISTPTN